MHRVINSDERKVGTRTGVYKGICVQMTKAEYHALRRIAKHDNRPMAIEIRWLISQRDKRL